MKKLLSTVASATALAACLSGTAHADQVVFLPPTFGPGLTQLDPFSDDLTADGGFTDTYIFANAPSFSLDEYTATAGAGVDFQSVTLSVYAGSAVALQGTFSASGFDLSPTVVLPGATYVLQIIGTGVTGGHYGGLISTTSTDAPSPSPVPEPASLALLLAGGAALALRRKRG